MDAAFSEFAQPLTGNQKGELRAEWRRQKAQLRGLRLSLQIARNDLAVNERLLAAVEAPALADSPGPLPGLDELVSRKRMRSVEVAVGAPQEEPQLQSTTPSSTSPPQSIGLNRRSPIFSLAREFLTAPSRRDAERNKELAELQRQRAEVKDRVLQDKRAADKAQYTALVAQGSARVAELDREEQEMAKRFRAITDAISVEAAKMEDEYCLAFFLRASGAPEAPFDVYFKPRCHSEETEMIVRSQITEVLPRYSAHRAPIDALLVEMEERRAPREVVQHQLSDDDDDEGRGGEADAAENR